jgi:hypothetical protein
MQYEVINLSNTSKIAVKTTSVEVLK